MQHITSANCLIANMQTRKYSLPFIKRGFCLFLLLFFSQQYVSAQIVKSSTINFRELAAYEAAHPELLKLCSTCKEKEADRREGTDKAWEGINNPNMLILDPTQIRRQVISPVAGNSPLPMGPSIAPSQQWLGHIDPSLTIPPDTHGAVGLNHVITATNDFIKIHAKQGGAQISQVSISTFTGVASTCDPYMIFDPTAQRWIFSAISCANVGNVMILMTSNTPDPTGTWRKITWVPAGPTMLLDHPYVGFDNQRIVLSGRRFVGPTINTVIFAGPSLFLITKAAMYTGTAITFGTNAQQIDKTTVDGDAPLPVTVYDPPYSTVGNPSPGTFYILQGWNGSSIRLSTVTGAIPAATWNSGSAVFPTSAMGSWNNGNLGNFAEQQLPETRKLATNDARISCGVMMNGSIWASHHIGLPAAGTNRVAVQWWKLSNLGAVIQNGRVGGTAANTYKWFSSIAVNKSEEVIIGYTASTNTTMVNAAYVTRTTATPLNTTDNENIYRPGQSRYWKDFNSGRARWGDYSHSALDPVDQSLWTIQEYASTAAGLIPPDGNSRYGVWWAQVNAKPDLFIRDNDPGDDGTEPNPLASGVFWASPDIWVCNSGFPVLCAAHTNPIGSNHNTVRVKVTNRGGAASLGNEVLKVYWAKASTSLDWDNSWKVTGLPLLCTGQPRGALFGTATITTPIPPGGSQIVNFDWVPPDPSNYNCFGAEKSHFCLLARIETSSSAPFGMTFPETTDLWLNVKNNNNIAWKNVSITDLNPAGPGIPPPPVPGQNNTTVLIAGEKYSGKKVTATRLDFAVPAAEARQNIHNFANIHIDLGQFFDNWKQNGAGGKGFIVEVLKVPVYINDKEYVFVDKTLLRLTAPDAYVDGIVLAPDAIGPIGVMVTQTLDYPFRDPLHLDVIQRDAQKTAAIVGGENYDFRLMAKAPVAQSLFLTEAIANAENNLKIDIIVDPVTKTIKANENVTSNGSYFVEVWDNSGKQLMNKVMNSPVTVNGEGWPKGIYVIRIMNTATRKTIVKRIQL
jgi:hypothetical protein